MMNILNGSKPADNSVDFQEFMVMPSARRCCRSVALRWATLRQSVTKADLATGYKHGTDIPIALDPAVGSFFVAGPAN